MVALSVIIPVFNAEKVLHNCLRGLIGQGFDNFEILVIDNNATDKSSVIVRNFQRLDSRIRYVICKKQGVSCARNMGIEIALGEYIYFMDSDDDLKLDALAKLYSYAKKSSAEAVVSNILYCKKDVYYPMDPSDVDVFAQNEEIPKLFYDKLKTYVMYAPFKFYKRQFLLDKNIRYDEDLSLGEDIIFNINVYRNASSIYYISDPLYIYMISAGGLNSKYRPNYIYLKELIADYVRGYLTDHNVMGPDYYRSLFQDVFAIFVNEMKSKNKDWGKIYKLPLLKELMDSNVFSHLSLPKKIVFLFIKFKMTPLIRLAGMLYMTSI